FAGLAPVWDGQLDEPVPGQDGWQIRAHGAGTFGSQFRAFWTTGGGSWGTGAAAQDAITQAIGRGLRWIDGGNLNPLPSGAWLGQAPATGADAVTDMLNLICSLGGLAWQVTAGPGATS